MIKMIKAIKTSHTQIKFKLNQLKLKVIRELRWWAACQLDYIAVYVFGTVLGYAVSLAFILVCIKLSTVSELERKLWVDAVEHFFLAHFNRPGPEGITYLTFVYCDFMYNDNDLALHELTLRQILTQADIGVKQWFLIYGPPRLALDLESMLKCFVWFVGLTEVPVYGMTYLTSFFDFIGIYPEFGPALHTRKTLWNDVITILWGMPKLLSLFFDTAASWERITDELVAIWVELRVIAAEFKVQLDAAVAKWFLKYGPPPLTFSSTFNDWVVWFFWFLSNCVINRNGGHFSLYAIHHQWFPYSQSNFTLSFFDFIFFVPTYRVSCTIELTYLHPALHDPAAVGRELMTALVNFKIELAAAVVKWFLKYGPPPLTLDTMWKCFIWFGGLTAVPVYGMTYLALFFDFIGIYDEFGPALHTREPLFMELRNIRTFLHEQVTISPIPKNRHVIDAAFYPRQVPGQFNLDYSKAVLADYRRHMSWWEDLQGSNPASSWKWVFSYYDSCSNCFFQKKYHFGEDIFSRPLVGNSDLKWRLVFNSYSEVHQYLVTQYFAHESFSYQCRSDRILGDLHTVYVPKSGHEARVQLGTVHLLLPAELFQNKVQLDVDRLLHLMQFYYDYWYGMTNDPNVFKTVSTGRHKWDPVFDHHLVSDHLCPQGVLAVNLGPNNTVVICRDFNGGCRMHLLFERVLKANYVYKLPVNPPN